MTKKADTDAWRAAAEMRQREYFGVTIRECRNVFSSDFILPPNGLENVFRIRMRKPEALHTFGTAPPSPFFSPVRPFFLSSYNKRYHKGKLTAREISLIFITNEIHFHGM